ncbi:uncharacterized protein LOC132753140 [Ruditapes philippinarum]|uniref:uncharacterized protein LOC132753140 n=1 Tax=Ruditapes philippinarum TaxID=129788 RepID=UPI00295A92BB|nr:uncharacterized protein LOC132753140 [Ruditapes philippinarum]
MMHEDENGPEVKVKNLSSFPKIFQMSLNSDIEFRKVPGCDKTLCDRFGRTMIMAHYKDVYIGLSLLVEKFDKTTLDKFDDFGSNLLHYIAWEETTEDFFITSRVYLKIVPFSKLSVSKDAHGQLPCDVAFLRGHSNILNQICVCKNGIHHQNLVFCHRRFRITSVIEKDEAFKNFIKDLSIHCSESKIRNLINVPLLGLVRFNKHESKVIQNMDRFEKAANDLKTVVVNVVNHICKRLGEKDESLKNTVILSGSVAENTKVGLPDEFDFICLLDKSAITVKVKERLKKGVLKRFFVFNKHRLSFIIDRLYDIIIEVLKEPDIYAHTNLVPLKECPERPTRSPNFKIKFQWCFREYKNMTIKIDIVPAFEVYCPFNVCFHSERFNPAINHSKFVMVLFTATNKAKERILCSVSASREERHRLATLPSEARDAYVISKILCGKRMCPSVVEFELEQTRDGYPINETQCQKNISSYMLKNCLFYVAEEFQTKSLSVYGYVCKIFQKLLQFASEEKFPCYMFPCIDLFVYHDGERHDGACLTRAMYAKIILNIIGEHCDFDDIGKPVGGLYHYICENCENCGTRPKADGVNFKTCPRCKNGSYCSDECKENDFERHKKWCDSLYEENISEKSWLYTRLGPIQNITDNDICANCKKSPKDVGVVLKTCSRCELWTHCSDDCKESNFERHKPACDYHYKQNGSN